MENYESYEEFELSPNVYRAKKEGSFIEIFDNHFLDNLGRFLPGFFIKKTEKVDSVNIIKMNYWSIRGDIIDFLERKSTSVFDDENGFEEEVVETPGQNYTVLTQDINSIYIIRNNDPKWLKENSTHRVSSYKIKEEANPFKLEEELYFLAKKQASKMCSNNPSKILDKTHFM